MDYERYKNLRKKNKNITLEHYCMLNTEQRKALGFYDTDQQFEESERALKSLPLIDVKVEYYVDGEKEIAVGDFMTVKLTITHKFLEDKEQLGFVHSNKFPYLKQSSWFLVFTDHEENDFFAMEKLVIKEKVFVKEIKERL